MARTAAVRQLGATSEISLARSEDDVELRALLRRAVIPGAVRVALTREPDYFAAEGMAGSEDVTLVARQEQRLVGMGRCSVNTFYRNGTPQRIGYLGELRVADDAARSATLLRDGYDFLVRHAAPADGFFTSIASDNLRARRVLERAERLGLPAYTMLCDIVTLVIPVGRPVGRDRVRDIDVADLTTFLDYQSQQYHLTLTWSVSRWSELVHHGVSPAAMTAVVDRGNIIGGAIIWDQRAFRQVVVDGYDRPLRMAKPLYNGVQTLRGMAPLPPAGSTLAQGLLLGAFVNEPADWTALWPLLAQRARAMGLSWLTVARQEGDPELTILRALSGVREYRSSLYAVDWRDGPRWADGWQPRSFRPEVSLL